jgi:hypothetical protein
MMASPHPRHTLVSLTLMNAALLATDAHAQTADGGFAIWFFKVRRKGLANERVIGGGERHDVGT